MILFAELLRAYVEPKTRLSEVMFAPFLFIQLTRGAIDAVADSRLGKGVVVASL